MSVSKLETLPNEILIDIFEKYINGVDIIVAFAYQQNQRFDALIAQCQRLRFNFFNCRKNDFRLCVGLLPAYVNKIEKLVLSEQNTPGQIHAFFTFFPSFIAFQRLRQLYLYLDARAVDWLVVQGAMLSLSNTVLNTLSIKIINTAKISTLNYVIAGIFHLKTLKQFSIFSDDQRIQWDFLTYVSSKIEYLTISDMHCQFEHLESIFRCANELKYLNMRLTSATHYGFYQFTPHPKSNIISMPTLRTLILSFDESDSTTFDMLAQYLIVMPVLRRLEIKAHCLLLDASAWETLLQTSLPLLTHFILRTTTSCIKEADIYKILSSFETLFWIEKKNFYMIITKHQRLNDNIFKIDNIQMIDRYQFDLPVIQWWTVPFRARIDNIPTNEITSLAISGVFNSLSCYHYFNNVKYFKIHNLDKDVLEWIKYYVNYSRIEYLDIPILSKGFDSITSLLSFVRNIGSLRIEYEDLLLHQHAFIGQDNCLKYLDISLRQHNFKKKDIITISKLFPGIEHLAINTINLSNVPILMTYLPHLRSLTFKIIDFRFPLLDDYQKRLWDAELRKKVHFFFQRDSDWITIWIDQAALTEPYWQTFVPSITSFFQRISSFFI